VSEKDERDIGEILAYTTEIVSSHVSNNAVAVDDVTKLITQVFTTLDQLGRGTDMTQESGPIPAVPVSKSITPDFLICLEDGKKLKMLKRHLKTHYDMTPEDYRQKWGLAGDYPMVAPNYAKKRQALAKEIGLGTHRTSRRS